MARVTLALAVGVALVLIVCMVGGQEDDAPADVPADLARAAPAPAEVGDLRTAAAVPEVAPPPGWVPPPRWGPNVRAYLDSGPSERCLDIVFVGDGYREIDLEDGTYWKDVERHASGILAEIPFSWYRTSINIRAVFLPSKMEGCDLSWGVDRVDTALDCAFDSRTGRLLSFRDVHALRNAIRRAGEAEAVLVMVNTKFFGGSGSGKTIQISGGWFRAATFSPRSPDSVRVAIHELGHSVGRLADEYDNPGDEESHPMPRDGRDLEARNVQVEEFLDRTDRASLARTAKWGHFLGLPGAEGHPWAHEGGYYRRTAIWRPWRRCLMRNHGDPFCPVCCEEISKAIVRRTGLSWDDRAWHAAHPLSLWAR